MIICHNISKYFSKKFILNNLNFYKKNVNIYHNVPKKIDFYFKLN